LKHNKLLILNGIFLVFLNLSCKKEITEKLNNDSHLENSKSTKKQSIPSQQADNSSKPWQPKITKSNSSVFKYKKITRFKKGSLDFQADLIQFKDLKAIERIASNFFHTGAISYKNLIQTEIKYWSKPSNRSSGEFISPDYYFYYKSEILLETSGIICMRFDLQEYRGASHPNFTTRYIIFDKTKKSELKISDLVGKKNISNFWKIAETFFWKEVPDQLLLEPRFFRSKRIGINADGIILFYHLYEITPYSSSSNGVQFTIPFESIYPILNEDTRKKLFK
jgi:hypothetical protein